MDIMYAVIDENKQLKEASPGITRDLAMVALALAKAGKLPNVSFKKQKNLYFIEASEASWEKANRRLKRFNYNLMI